jgi:aspartate/methionine/tyrosine aminotransferase
VSFPRELGRFDTAMVVVGGITGAGVFINPYIVAQRLDAVGSIPSETIGTLAFERPDHLLERARCVLEPGARRFRSFVERRPERVWVPPVGGSVGFPRLDGVDDAEPFVELAMRDFDVGVPPGRFFGEPAHFRVVVAGPFDVLERGLDALGRALARWSGGA